MTQRPPRSADRLDTPPEITRPRGLAVRLPAALVAGAIALASSSAAAEVPEEPIPPLPAPTYYIYVPPAPVQPRIPTTHTRWSTLDPLVYSGIAVTVTGAVAATAGFAFLGSPERRIVCGLTGCVSGIDHVGRIRATAFLSSAGAMFAVGVPTLIAGASGRSPDAGERTSPRAAMFGAWLTGFGAGASAFGFGTALAAGKTSKIDDAGAALGIGAVGIAMIAAGIPLWAVGTRPVDPYERRVAPVTPARSEGRMNAGLALTSLGTVTLAGGVMLTASLGAERGDFAGYGVVLIGMPVMLAGSALLGVGLPLWLTGAGAKAVDPASMLPSVAAGPGSVQLEWRFQ